MRRDINIASLLQLFKNCTFELAAGKGSEPHACQQLTFFLDLLSNSSYELRGNTIWANLLCPLPSSRCHLAAGSRRFSSARVRRLSVMVEGGVAVSRLRVVIVRVTCVIGCGGIHGVEIARLPIASQGTTVGIVSHGVGGEAGCVPSTHQSRLFRFLSFAKLALPPDGSVGWPGERRQR